MASRIVFAFTIGKIEEKGWDYRLVPADTEQFTPVLVDARWVKDHAPQVGGTYTRFENGEASYSPPRSTEPPPAPPVLAGTTTAGTSTTEDGESVEAGTTLFIPAGEPIPGEEDTRDLEP